jgi:trans-2,3-dihydro-3-hydroxyanthranilate isomerase
MRRRFVTLDVFTSRRFAGNPLAVVLDAKGLETDAMQAITREFNLAETVFVLPAQEAAHRAYLRIFTPATELPFAGHPTVGAAVLLNRIDGGGAGKVPVKAT